MYFIGKTNLMKKLLCSIVLAISFCSAQAQNTYTDSPGRWRLGLNMGAIWESSDVMPIPGLGGGFNIEKILNKRASAPIGFSLGFRYLGGRTYGLNTAPTWNLQDNKALNGTYDKALRYDSVPGYFYANNKTFIQEGALEFKVNFPRFEQNTHLILHFWGGVGVGKYKTWIDAKDKNGNMYDFSSTKAQTMTQSDLSRLFDGSYETLAEGSGTNGTIRFIPSAGIGFGVRLSKYVAIVLEHKVSFPMTDYLDGFKYSGACANDFYHYTAANLIFTFHARSSTSTNTHTNTDQTVYTNTTVTTNTTTAVTGTVAPHPIGTPTVTNVPKAYPPSVRITYPQNNFNSQYDNVSVSAQLSNITSSQQIGITINGYPITHYSFNPSNDMLNFQSFLALGNNYFVITVTNSAGSATDQVNVVYAPTATVVPTFTVPNVNPTQTVTGTPTITPTNTVAVVHTPTVVTTTTVVNTPTVTPTQTTTVTSPTVVTTATTVASPTVTPTHTLSIPTHTITEATTHTATPVGTPTNTTIAGKPPAINIINPSLNPYEESHNSYNVSGSVLNVDNQSQISVMVNNVPLTQFSFGQNNKMVSFWVQLQEGPNTIVIKATNNYGSDSKSTVINYRPGKPPKVVISVPAASPYTSLSANTEVSGSVYSVNSWNDIMVTANGTSVPFNFNTSTNAIHIPLILKAETTQVTITATNQFGSDAQSATLICRNVGATQTQLDTFKTANIDNTQTATTGTLHRKPTITVITPVADPFYTNNSTVNVVADIGFVLSNSGVMVSYNGAPVTSSFDPNSHKLDFTAPLVPGMNTFVITAINHDGSTTHNVNVNYTPISNPGNNNQGINQNGGGGGKPNIFQPKLNTGGGGIFNPGRPNPTPTENKGDIKTTPNQPINNTPRTITPTITPAPNGGGRPSGGGGRTMGGGGGQ